MQGEDKDSLFNFPKEKKKISNKTLFPCHD